MERAVASPSEAPLLAIDTGSPEVGVAVGLALRAGGVRLLATRAVAMERSSRQLLGLIRDALAEAGFCLRDLGGIVALAGPGSFTGLRIGLATVLGFHQALGVPATALPTLAALASWAVDEGDSHPAFVLAAVDALRGDWTVQPFTATDPPLALASAELLPGAEIARLAPGSGPGLAVGFGLSRLRGLLPDRIALREPGALAPAALRLAAALPPAGWDAAALTAPLYARPPAVTAPRPRPALAAP